MAKRGFLNTILLAGGKQSHNSMGPLYFFPRVERIQHRNAIYNAGTPARYTSPNKGAHE